MSPKDISITRSIRQPVFVDTDFALQILELTKKEKVDGILIMNKKIQNTDIYQKLIDSIGITIESARQRAIQSVNNELLKANWEIG